MTHENPRNKVVTYDMVLVRAVSYGFFFLLHFTIVTVLSAAVHPPYINAAASRIPLVCFCLF